MLAIYTIYRNFNSLIPDAPELIYNFLEVEQDMSCKRNAFMMLIHVDQKRALDYLSGCIDQVFNINFWAKKQATRELRGCFYKNVGD